MGNDDKGDDLDEFGLLSNLEVSNKYLEEILSKIANNKHLQIVHRDKDVPIVRKKWALPFGPVDVLPFSDKLIIVTTSKRFCGRKLLASSLAQDSILIQK